jgi:hypothetical protein
MKQQAEALRLVNLVEVQELVSAVSDGLYHQYGGALVFQETEQPQIVQLMKELNNILLVLEHSKNLHCLILPVDSCFFLFLRQNLTL